MEIDAAALELEPSAAELSAALEEDSLEIDAAAELELEPNAAELSAALEEDSLEIDAAAELELEANAASEEDGLLLDTPLLEAEGGSLVWAKAAADEVAATGELTDDLAGEAASAGVDVGLAGAGALDTARAGTAAPARTRRWLSFMSKEILYENSIREACARRQLVVPLQVKSPWSLDLWRSCLQRQ